MFIKGAVLGLLVMLIRLLLVCLKIIFLLHLFTLHSIARVCRVLHNIAVSFRLGPAHRQMASITKADPETYN